MLQNNKNILWKLFCIGTAMMISGPALCANQLTASAVAKKDVWTDLKIPGIKIAESEAVLGGCVGLNCPGTIHQVQQNHIIVNMARKINANGAYFCPTQVELEIYRYGGNYNTGGAYANLSQMMQQASQQNYGYGVAGFRFYEPASSASCRWICKDGFTGNECATTDNGSNPGSTSMKSLKENVTTRRGTGSEGLVGGTIDVFDYGIISEGSRYWVRVLAILKYLDHGVHVGSLWIYGQSNLGYSYIYKAHTEADGQTYNGTANGDYILCDEGYKVNAAKNDCELMQSGVVLKAWCDGWSEDQFKATEGVQYFVTADDCRKFKCTDTSKGFSSESSRTCEPCANAGGVDANGICQTCPVGQTYKNGGCVSMTAINKLQMQFGPNGAPVGKSSDACWTKTDLTEYKQCVFGN
jgi:hypothetical protein